MVDINKAPEELFNPVESPAILEGLQWLARKALDVATIVATVYLVDEYTKPIRNRND